jgi:hypothetical protein
MGNSTSLVQVKKDLKNSLSTQQQTYLQTSKISSSRKERLEKIKSIFFLRNLEDSGQKQLDTEVLRARVISYERHLTNYGIEPENYEKVYEMAVKLYVDNGNKGPFGIYEILEGAKALNSSIPLKPSFPEEGKVEKIKCDFCNGTSLEYSRDSKGNLGKIKYETIKGKKVAKRCTYCYESQN